MTYALTSRTRQHARKFPDPPYCVDSNSVQAQGLVLWLPLDPRGGGTVFDLSGYGHLGTLTNGPTWAYDDHGNGALSFDGTNDEATLPSGGGPRLPPDGYTLSARFLATSVGGVRSVVYHAVPTVSVDTHNRELILNGGFLRTGAATSAGVWSAGTLVTGATAVSTGRWYHGAGVGAAGDALRVYLDGRQDGSAAYASQFSATDQTWYTGRAHNGWFFSGLVADVRVHTYALPAALVWDVYDRPAALAYPLRRRVWSFPRFSAAWARNANTVLGAGRA